MRSKRKGVMKQIIALLLGVVVTLGAIPLMPTQAAVDTSEAPSRVINLVYDDSGSMIRESKTKLVDTWCQAKYAMEVFAGMLGEKDTMNVYVMSDFDNNGAKSSSPRLILSGSEGTSVNVKKVHDMITSAGDTPIQSVIQAYDDLTKASADEKWLVVLTDGVFQDVDSTIGDLDSYFAKKDSDINVMFLGMGADADGITPHEGNNIYFEKAQTSKDILTKITGICTRIFNRNRLEVNGSSITFDVPMSELIIFAQGANVQIDGIQPSDGDLIKWSTNPVTVKYSTQATTNTKVYTDCIYDENLLGSIATFKGDFVAGNYTLKVTGAETIEVYYAPNVAVKAYLKDLSGNDIPEDANLMEGEYIIEYGLVKTGTSEPVPESKLLGEVTYEAIVTNGGVTHEQTYASGDKVSLQEGSLVIDVTARYLEYNKVYATLEYDTVYKNKLITYSLAEDSEYKVTKNGFESDEPVKVKAYLDGREYTQAEWDQMGIPEVVKTTETEGKMSAYKVEKSDEIGIFYVTPVIKSFWGEGKPSQGKYTDCNFEISYNAVHDKVVWSGSEEFVNQITDTRSCIEIYGWWWLLWILLGIIGLWILGSILPFFKKRFPKEMKKNPLIEQSKIKRTDRNAYNDRHEGEFVKYGWSVILPFIAERGRLRFVPDIPGMDEYSEFKLKAASGGMYITNTSDYSECEKLTIDDQQKLKNSTGEELLVSWNTKIEVKDDHHTYTCVPTLEYTEE